MKKLLVPTIVVIFGITGDLAQKKLLPALYDLYEKNLLPENFRVIGFARRELTDDDIKKTVHDSISNEAGNKDDFVSRFEYMKGDFASLASFASLKKHIDEIDASWGVCTNKLLYLAVPPQLYKNLFINIHASGLATGSNDEMGWNRILVEKPFGTNEREARELDIMLGKLFDERQVFRIDHYLAKETMQNILTFRFTNSLFETLWNKDTVESVEISLFEANDVSDRGDFYDSMGALFDVGQNHMLQMLALSAMRKPRSNECQDIRSERAKILKSVKIDRESMPIRLQYEGYGNEIGVKQNSETETAFGFIAKIRKWGWRNVPFYIRAGKAFGRPFAEIKYTFRDRDPLRYTPSKYAKQEKNTLTFRIQPSEGITLSFWFKVPGLKSEVEQREMEYKYEDEQNGRGAEAYEKVLYDCFVGDQTLFASTEELLSSWKITHEVEKLMKKTELIKYKKNSDPDHVFADWQNGKKMIQS